MCYDCFACYVLTRLILFLPMIFVFVQIYNWGIMAIAVDYRLMAELFGGLVCVCTCLQRLGAYLGLKWGYLGLGGYLIFWWIVVVMNEVKK